MEDINLKMKGFWYNLMRFSYVISLPSNTCAYKRRLILSAIIAVLLLPLTILRLIWRGFTVITDAHFSAVVNGGNGYGNSMMSIFVPYALGVCWVVLVPKFSESGNISIWFWGLLFLLCIIVFIVLIVLSIIGISKLVMSLKASDKPNNNETVEPTNTVGILYKSWKDKYCKKINWESKSKF